MLSVLRQVTSRGNRYEPQGWLLALLLLVIGGVAVFEIWLGLLATMSPFKFAVIFLMAMVFIIFITYTWCKEAYKLTLYDYLLAFLSLFIGLYLFWNADYYITRVSGLNPLTTTDIVMGCIVMFLTFEATRRVVGVALLSVVIVFLLYTFFGQLLSGPFAHPPLRFEKIIDLYVFSPDGVFGVTIQVVAKYVFLFMLFGIFFQKAGGGQLFFDIANLLTKGQIGGPAKVAVISSGLFGTVSGSPSADVVTTGSVTIPMMKRVGYRAEFAGGAEAAASSGGSIMPPVMGSAALVMADFTGIGYTTIARSAIIVGLLYYVSVFLQVHLRSRKLNIRGEVESDITLWQILKRGAHTLIPIVILVYGIMIGYTPGYVGAVAVLALLVTSWFRKETRITWNRVIAGIKEVALLSGPIVAASAAAGLVIGGITITGLAGKVTSMVFALTGGQIMITLIVAMLATIVLGMGLPVAPVYVLTAALVAPALIQLGFGTLETHLFFVYFAAASAITPPIAVAAFAAAGIADADPLKVAFQACRLGIVAFIIPFVFIFDPSILLQGAWQETLLTSLTALVGICFLCFGIEGYLFRHLASWSRVLFVIAGLCLIDPGAMTNLSGLALGLLLVIFHWVSGKTKTFYTAGHPEQKKQ